MAAHRSPVRAFFRRYVVALGAASAVMVAGVVAVNYVIDRKLENVVRVQVHTAPAPPQGANYLLIGSDTRAFVKNQGDEEAFGDPTKEGGQRSDTMMVLHVEPGAQRTLVVSFPRDLIVQIPGRGRTLINAAFNDGPDKVIETLKQNFGIEINHYLEVDFKTFKGIVKAVGDVPIYLPYAARDWDSEGRGGRGVNPTGLYSPAGGCPKLDGDAALAYVRARHLQYYSTVQKRWISADPRADLDRIKRQQDFMRKLAGIAVQKSLNNPLTANEVADRVLENLKIDDSLTKDDIFSLIDAFRTVNPDDPNSINFQTFPVAPDAQNVHLVVKQPEAKAMSAALMNFSADKALPPSIAPSSVTLKVLNGTGQTGAARSAVEQFVQIGFTSGGSGNDPRGTVRNTEVRVGPNAKDAGKFVLGFIDPKPRFVVDSSLKGSHVTVVLGNDFRSILIPGIATTAPIGSTPAASTPVAVAPPTTTPGVAPASGDTGLPESEFGKPAVRKPPC